MSGLDTVQAAYYLRPHFKGVFRFEPLMVAKERLRADKNRDGELVQIGELSFLLQAYGSKSGYPLVLDHEDFTVECGEFNNPSFFVTYRSKALWQKGAKALHSGFLAWAEAVGLVVVRPETLSRTDFAFDYLLASPDFTSDSVVSLSTKDAQYRGDRKVQTIQFGKGDVVLRIYNKVVEIEEQSDKVWLFQLWGASENVWRIEWQVRKEVLRRFSIRTFEDLFAGYGDVLRYLASEHDSLRVPNGDSNRSRWPLHPLWADLIGQIDALPCQGVYREVDDQVAIRERLARLSVMLYGYCKRIAALVGLRDRSDKVAFGQAMSELRLMLESAHDPFTWDTEVAAKRAEDRYKGG
ncbi:MAG: hypothetical protein KGL36_03025 [Gammaproteobacteria bacterium]|nr:hypothetical protein [Gammaproteobacteria bacterium]